jgi:hypothetical protein
MADGIRAESNRRPGTGGLFIYYPPETTGSIKNCLPVLRFWWLFQLNCPMGTAYFIFKQL